MASVMRPDDLLGFELFELLPDAILAVDGQGFDTPIVSLADCSGSSRQLWFRGRSKNGCRTTSGNVTSPIAAKTVRSGARGRWVPALTSSASVAERPVVLPPEQRNGGTDANVISGGG